MCELKVFCSPSQFKAAKEAVNAVFTDIEAHFSPESTDYSSEIVLSLYQKAYTLYLDSGGKFDISVGALSKIWGFHDQSYRVPTLEELDGAMRSVGMDKIQIRDGRLILAPGVQLDWGGIAKGYGLDLAANILKTKGLSNGFVNAGGDLYCWGTNPDGGSWRIGIKHPRKSGFSGILSISDEGAATTGDYQRFFIENGTRYHHVFDPHSGFPAKGKQSVTVVGPEATFCDALSTALFVSAHPGSILDKYPRYSAIIIDSDGNLTTLGKPVIFVSVE